MTGSEHLQNCSSCWVLLVCGGQYLSKLVKEGTVVNQQQGHGQPRLTDTCGKERLARMGLSKRWVTDAQIAEEVNAGSNPDRKVSEYTVESCLVWWITFSFTSRGWLGLSVTYLGKTWHQFCWETCHLCGSYCDAYHLPKHCCRPCTPFHGSIFPDGCGFFQQDNVTFYRAKMVQEWFEEHSNEFEVLTRPPISPDLNPIEQLCDVLDEQVQSMEVPPCFCLCC